MEMSRYGVSIKQDLWIIKARKVFLPLMGKKKEIFQQVLMCETDVLCGL